MPGRIKRQPSGRNLELYYELVCEGRLQAEVAERFRVTPGRVCQLRREVAAWVEGLLPEEAAAALPDAGRRLHLAIALQRTQLEAAYADYLRHFGGQRGAAGWGHWLLVRDAGVVPTAIQTRLWPRKLIETAVRMARELSVLDAIATRGPLAQQLAASLGK